MGDVNATIKIDPSSQSSLEKIESGHEKGQEVPPPTPYTAFSIPRRNFILLVVTVAGFFGPLSGGIYLPALNVLAQEFNVSGNLINVTVSVFMLVFAVGVRTTILTPWLLWQSLE